MSIVQYSCEFFLRPWGKLVTLLFCMKSHDTISTARDFYDTDAIVWGVDCHGICMYFCMYIKQLPP